MDSNFGGLEFFTWQLGGQTSPGWNVGPGGTSVLLKESASPWPIEPEDSWRCSVWQSGPTTGWDKAQEPNAKEA